jgi:RES domain-containing protein
MGLQANTPLWRVSEFAVLDGGGGLVVGGRWHTKGRRVVYLAESSALAILETLVHLEVSTPPPSFQLIKVLISEQLEFETCPSELDHFDAEKTREWGNAWLDSGRSALARVPSVISPYGVNWLLNPLHGDAPKVVLEDASRWPWDHRLFPN